MGGGAGASGSGIAGMGNGMSGMDSGWAAGVVLGGVPWDDDYRALRARLEVPSLGFGSLRTPGQGTCVRS